MVAGTAYSAPAWGTRQGHSLASSAEPARRARDRARRRADQAAGPRAMNGFKAGPAQAAAAAAASPPNTPAAWAAARSTIWSPMATPPRKASFERIRRNTAKGRFWMGKSLPAALAEASQLFRPGSWVSFRTVIMAAPD